MAIHARCLDMPIVYVTLDRVIKNAPIIPLTRTIAAALWNYAFTNVITMPLRELFRREEGDQINVRTNYGGR